MMPSAKRILLVVHKLEPTVDDMPATVQQLVEVGALDKREPSVASGSSSAPRLIDAKGVSVFVLTPALNSLVGTLVADSDDALRRAKERLKAVLADLHEGGVAAEGVVGDEDPLLAIEDVLRTHAIDEIVFVVHAPGQENWREPDVVEKAREKFGLPTTEIVVSERVAAKR